MKKFLQILLDILVCGFLALAIVVIVLVVVSNRDVDGTAEIMGYQLRIVTSDSMGECEFTDVSGYEIKSIPIKSLIIVKTMPKEEELVNDWYRELKPGDVLTFRYVYGNQITITHRLSSITENEDGFVIDLAGDNVNAQNNQLYQTIDTSIPDNPNYVIGKVVWASEWAGKVFNSIKTPIGLVFLIWIPCVIITIMQVYEIGSSTTEGAEKPKKSRRTQVAFVPQEDGYIRPYWKKQRYGDSKRDRIDHISPYWNNTWQHNTWREGKNDVSAYWKAQRYKGNKINNPPSNAYAENQLNPKENKTSSSYSWKNIR